MAPAWHNPKTGKISPGGRMCHRQRASFKAHPPPLSDERDGAPSPHPTLSPRWGRGVQDNALFVHAADVGPDGGELFFDGLVTAVDVVGAVDVGGALGDQAGQD